MPRRHRICGLFAENLQRQNSQCDPSYPHMGLRRRAESAQPFDHVNRCAAGLQALGLQKGDRLGLMMANCPQFVIAYFGALQAGAIVTATSSMYTRREAAHQWHDAGVSILIVDRRLYPTA